MIKYKLAPIFILNVLKVRNETNVTIPNQIYKARSTYRSSLRGPYTEMQHLLKLIQQENYVHWTRRRENSDILRDIFWTHPDCIKLLNTFHFVLICDSTYKTNRYRLPLLEIVGVTSTSLTFSVGFAYLEKERQDNFIWAFEKVRMLFKSESLISKVIVTDRDLAMMNAISVVFPTSIHLLCRFHIEKNVGARCKQYVKNDRQEEVMDLWKKIVYSTSVEEYDHHLQQFELLCADIILFVDYVKDSWLTPYKERFVNVWTNRVMHLGNTTSNRVESAHWRLKNMLQTSFGDLCKSWDAVNMMLKNQICIIQSSFQKKSPFQKTIKDVEHGTTHGLPCACELAKLQINALLGWTEESWALVRSQLDKEIGLHKDVYSNVFDDNVESQDYPLVEQYLIAPHDSDHIQYERDRAIRYVTIPIFSDTSYGPINLAVSFFAFNTLPSLLECNL
ncbi:protein FAR-RED ELONGATED HYPOCOTYL 3-like [Cicer arietinum]|uniref:protein FAR-RED ELONGATED HYPOCOTYL 3-like n=1 Tax=Cicer arietinum TaxID=3827 RepID=UPI003CC5F9F5